LEKNPPLKNDFFGLEQGSHELQQSPPGPPAVATLHAMNAAAAIESMCFMNRSLL
jgi:hypothetical protein